MSVAETFECRKQSMCHPSCPAILPILPSFPRPLPSEVFAAFDKDSLTSHIGRRAWISCLLSATVCLSVGLSVLPVAAPLSGFNTDTTVLLGK